MSPSAPAVKVWTNFMLFEFPLMSVEFRGGKGKEGVLWYTLRQREMAFGA